MTSEVTRMFSEEFMSSSGRWDVDGLKIFIAKMMGPDEDLEEKMKKMKVDG